MNHLKDATIKDVNKTFSIENLLKIMSDFIITKISAMDAMAHVAPISTLP